jgi:tetratricopeptide (TPR) repeat protein
MALGDYTEAQRVWQRAISLHPNHAEAHFNMGLLQLRMGRPEAAIPHFDRALALGEDAEIHRERGHALVGLQRLPEAALSYRNAARLAPGDIASRYNRAEVLLVLGESDLARGSQQAGLARWGEAERALLEVLHLAPGHARARIKLEQLRGRLQ